MDRYKSINELIYRNQPIKKIIKANQITIMVITDGNKRTRKSNTTMDFETLSFMVLNGFSWQNLGFCGANL
jgi:hypothetical protein